MLLSAFAADYGLANDVAPGTLAQYGFAVGALNRWACKPVKVESLQDDLVNRWITARLADGIARATVRNQAGAVLTLWRAAHEAGLVKRLPVRVKQVKPRAPLPEALELDELNRLLVAADAVPGRFRHVAAARAPLLRAYLLTGYYTGLRPCDLREIRPDAIGTNGVLLHRQAKTGWPVLCQLPPDAVAAIEATHPRERERVFPLSKKLLWYWWRKLKIAANVRGTPKWLRRTGATQSEIATPGSAMAFLGHKTPGLAWRHYVDARQVARVKPMPPPLVSQPDRRKQPPGLAG